MRNKEKRRLSILELTLSGYTQQKIAQKLNISTSTVFREIQRIRKGSEHWLENIAKQDLPHIIREGIDGLKQDLMLLTELLDEPTVKKNPDMQLRILKQITLVRNHYVTQLVGMPMAWSLEVLRKKYGEIRIPYATMDSLNGITGVTKTK